MISTAGRHHLVQSDLRSSKTGVYAPAIGGSSDVPNWNMAWMRTMDMLSACAWQEFMVFVVPPQPMCAVGIQGEQCLCAHQPFGLRTRGQAAHSERLLLGFIMSCSAMLLYFTLFSSSCLSVQ